MLSMMTAAFRFTTAVSLSARPRSNRGVIRGERRRGEDFGLTKVVAPSRWMVAGTFSGPETHLISSGI